MTGAKYARRGLPRCGFAALALVLSIAPTVAAQSITDARRVEFTPSPDHNTVDPTGLALVNNYTLDVFLAGGASVVQTANLGKPAPETDGMIRVDFVALLPNLPTAGVIYEAVVSAVGPGGTSPSARSNTFAFSLPCPPTISPSSQSLSGTGGSVTVTVSGAAGCAWTAVSNDTWITVTTGAAGAGPGTVTLSVAANPGTASRTGTVTIGSNTFTVTQAGTPCSYTLSPTSQTFAAAGGTVTVTVTTGAGCTWTSSSGSSWATITSGGGTRTGSGSVGITAASNLTTQSRTATLTIAGKSFGVTEQAATCTYTVAPLTVTVPPGGATGNLSVTTLSTCAWTTSSSGAAWISLTGSGPGSGNATYTIGANTGGTSRTVQVTVAGVSVRFDQGILTAPTAPSNLRVIKSGLP